MSITGAPVEVLMGGSYTSGTAEGDYHVIVSDAQLGLAKTGRPQLIAQLTVKNDPAHPAREGKPLTRMFQSLPQPGDPEDKRDSMKGMVKRLWYDGFGVPWPKEDKKLDARLFINKEAYVRLAKKEGKAFPDVVAVATTLDGLPPKHGAPTAPNGKSAAAPRSRR